MALKQFQPVVQQDCNGCTFLVEQKCIKPRTADFCSANARKDKMNVIFLPKQDIFYLLTNGKHVYFCDYASLTAYEGMKILGNFKTRESAANEALRITILTSWI